MNKLLSFVVFAVAISTQIACDVQSGIARKSVEPHLATPTPTRSPILTPTPIDPADVITVEIGEQGPNLTVNDSGKKITVDCTKYNRVMVNGDKNTITVKGACASILFNGDNNQAEVNASHEFVFNGDNNVVTYSKYINGRHSILTDNKKTNSVEKKVVTAKSSV